ncbi:hypothetical protein MicvaDRAFT_0097 [Microcoleus vaginatus FGP-2]|nr:hypothetical protein MicvaDRAFT_0097 [Microcoleus vaginatus FGP-2]
MFVGKVGLENAPGDKKRPTALVEQEVSVKPALKVDLTKFHRTDYCAQL